LCIARNYWPCNFAIDLQVPVKIPASWSVLPM
jgi:hypothetical protein